MEIYNTLNHQQQQQMNAYNGNMSGITVTVPDDKVCIAAIALLTNENAQSS